MIRRFIFVVWGFAVVGSLVFGRHSSSYVRTADGLGDRFGQASGARWNFEITRARNEVKNIMPEIRKNMQTIAKEEVEVDRLTQEIASLGDASRTKIAPI